MTETQPTYHWVLRYSSVAFTLLVVMQSYGVITATPQFENLLAGFGASIPPMTIFALKAYWIGSVVTVIISLVSTIYICLRSSASEARIKIAYLFSLASLVGAFAWSGFVVVAVYQPIFKMAAPF